MLVLISGASGLVGTALERALVARGDRVRRLVRREVRDASCEVIWDPAARTIDPKALEGVDAVVNLAGENIAARRWNEAHKARLVQSRVDATATIATAIHAATTRTRPRVLVNASAIGIYGDTGARRITEDAPVGPGFLAELCRAWEAETASVAADGVRVVLARIGIVLAREGGALAKMILPFRLGVGGRIGDGAQGFSWIAIDDVVGAMLFAIDHAEVTGPVNVTAPEPVSNAEFTKALGRVLRRPTPFPVPRFALRLAAGSEMADEMLLGGSYVLPAKLERLGYGFRHRTLDSALAMLRDA